MYEAGKARHILCHFFSFSDNHIAPAVQRKIGTIMDIPICETKEMA